MTFDMKNRHLALIIYKEREKRNLTQEHLAQLAEVSPRTIQRLESSGTYSKETLMEQVAKTTSSWTAWRTTLEDFISMQKGEANNTAAN